MCLHKKHMLRVLIRWGDSNEYPQLVFCMKKSGNFSRNYYQIPTLPEPSHDKTNKMTVRPAKTQISLGIRPVWSEFRPVWSESSLCPQRVAKDPSFLHADSEDSDQTGRMPKLIWVFARRTGHFVGFVMFLCFFA